MFVWKLWECMFPMEHFDQTCGWKEKDFHPSFPEISNLFFEPFATSKKLKPFFPEFRKTTNFKWYWPASRMSLFPSSVFAFDSIYNTSLMISWLFHEGVFCSPVWSSDSMKWRQHLISMWNIYGAFELVYTERWKWLPNLGFMKKKETHRKATHASVSLVFDLK